MSRKVSLQVLADQLGLSKYAVSRALSGKSGVSTATRQRVIDLARALGYQNPVNAELPDILPDLSDFYILICIREIHANNQSYWQRVLKGVMEGCSAQGLKYMILSPDCQPSDTFASPQEAIAPHIDWSRCKGILMIGTFPHFIIQLISRTKRPYMLVDHSDSLVTSDRVNNDNIEAGLKITHHLLTLHCRRIVFLNDEDYSSSFADRLTGARLAVEGPDSTYTLDATLTEWKIQYSEAGWEQRLLHKLASLDHSELPDAWIGANDDIAIRWMHQLQAEGWKIPEVMRVAGIDNVEAAVLVTPKLTTVNLCKEELGQRAVEALLRRMSRTGAPAESIHLSTNLIPRAST